MPPWFILSCKRIYSSEVMGVKFKKWLFPAGVLLLTMGLIIFPAEAAAGALCGLRVCGSALIPALLPYFVLSRLLISCTDLHALNTWAEKSMRFFFSVEGGCITALLTSFLGGYPAGAAAVVSLYERGTISKQSAERALRFCNNSGPGFFLGVAGGMVLDSIPAGLALYGIHVLSALCAGVLLASRDVPRAALKKLRPQEPPALSRAFSEAVSGSCAALLQISGLVIFFTAMTALLQRALPALPAQGLLTGLLELTSGITQLTGDWNTRFLCCAFLLSWGSVCVHFQASGLWRAAGLHPRGYWTEKLLHGLLSLLFAAAFLSKHPAVLALAGGIVGFCAFFPFLRKKRGGNPRSVVV